MPKLNTKKHYHLLLGLFTFLSLYPTTRVPVVQAGETTLTNQSEALPIPYTQAASLLQNQEYLAEQKAAKVKVSGKTLDSFVAQNSGATSGQAQDLFGTQAQSIPVPVPPNQPVYLDRQNTLVVPENGFYISITPGVLFGYDFEITSPSLTTGKIKTDSGFSVAGALGYKMRNFRFEGEFSYSKNGAGEVEFEDGTRRSLGGDFVTSTYMLNAYYDIPLTPRFRPYIGGGLGFANFSANDVFVYEANRLRGSNTLFAFQFKAGLGYQLNENVNVFIGYRLLGLDGQDYRSAGISVEGDSFVTHSLQFGGRITF